MKVKNFGITIIKIYNSNRRSTSLENAIIDLYMCIYSNDFLGTKHSSFTNFIYHNRCFYKI